MIFSHSVAEQGHSVRWLMFELDKVEVDLALLLFLARLTPPGATTHELFGLNSSHVNRTSIASFARVGIEHFAHLHLDVIALRQPIGRGFHERGGWESCAPPIHFDAFLELQ